MDNIYYVEISGNDVKSYINLNPKDVILKKVEAIEIKGIFLKGTHNSNFELEKIGEVSLIKQELNDCCYDYTELKRLLLDDDDIDIEDDIDIDDLFI